MLIAKMWRRGPHLAELFFDGEISIRKITRSRAIFPVCERGRFFKFEGTVISKPVKRSVDDYGVREEIGRFLSISVFT